MISESSPTTPSPHLHPVSVIQQLQPVQLSHPIPGSIPKLTLSGEEEDGGSASSSPVERKTSIRFAPLPNPRRAETFSEGVNNSKEILIENDSPVLTGRRNNEFSGVSDEDWEVPKGKQLGRVRSAPVTFGRDLKGSDSSPNSSRGNSPIRRSGSITSIYAKKWIKPLLGISKLSKKEEEDLASEDSDSKKSPHPSPNRPSPQIPRSKYPPVAQRSSRPPPVVSRYFGESYDAEFVEWDLRGRRAGRGVLSESVVGGMGSNRKFAVDEDEDDGGGMAWVKKRKMEREEKEKKEREEKERLDEEAARNVASAEATVSTHGQASPTSLATTPTLKQTNPNPLFLSPPAQNMDASSSSLSSSSRSPFSRGTGLSASGSDDEDENTSGDDEEDEEVEPEAMKDKCSAAAGKEIWHKHKDEEKLRSEGS